MEEQQQNNNTIRVLVNQKLGIWKTVPLPDWLDPVMFAMIADDCMNGTISTPEGVHDRFVQELPDWFATNGLVGALIVIDGQYKMVNN